MTSKNETWAAVAAGAVCLITGVLCYGFFPAKAPVVPVRVMLYALGGNVLFEHQTHSSAYNLECDDCHHLYVNGKSKEPQSCNACHHKDSQYRPALGKKGIFNHQAHEDDYGLDCVQCHHTYVEGQPGGLEPCSDCHLRHVEDKSILNRMEAFHKQCIGCHEDMGVSPGKTDCAGCHSPRKTMDAYHRQCIDCHEDLGAGPVEADCKECHGY